MGYISEDYALENLINLVKNQIDGAKYRSLTTTADRISYLRALAIGTLVSEAVQLFADNEEAILSGKLEKSLIDYSNHSAAIKDIIDLSVRIYMKPTRLSKRRLLDTKLSVTFSNILLQPCARRLLIKKRFTISLS